jgi:ApbE superfamily uncharacterized protein (UPF0280 family)
MKINGIRGLILVKDAQVGMAGKLPEIVRARQPDIEATVTRDPRAPAQAPRNLSDRS